MWYIKPIPYFGIPTDVLYEGIAYEPHPKQELLLQATEDVVGFGGAAGGGKTDGILFKALHRAESEAGTDIVAFRKTNADAIKPKAIWPRLLQMTAHQAQGHAGWASRNQPPYSVTHPYNSSRITIGHLQKPTTYLDWQGSGIDMFMFDELTHFTAEEFHYLRSRLAREEGRQSQVVFTCNPDPQSWVKQLLAPWVDDQHEWYPLDPDVVLYVETGETPEEVTHHKEPGKGRFSLRFIPSKLEDNPSIGAEYEKQLESLPKIFRDALLEGDWNLVVKAGAYFNIHVLPIGPRSDSPIVRTVRFWDTAGGQKQSGDYMVGCKMSRQKDGNIFIQDVWRERVSAGRIEQIILDVADRDGKHVLVGLEQEGASEAGAFVIGVRRKLQKKGIRSVSMRPRTDKGKRAQPFAAAAEQGLVSVADEPWRRAFVNELVLFPDGANDDQFDAGAGGYILVARKQGDYSYWSSSSGGVQ